MNRLAIDLLVVAGLSISSSAHAQISTTLDETWTVTINGRQVQVNPNGTVLIPNVSAADQFGPGGPGTRPDFLSDDFLQLIGVREVNGVTEYAFSERFQITRGQPYKIQNITITTTAPPTISALMLSAAAPTLTGQPPESTQLSTTAELNDGSFQDVTLRTDWTVYRTSNPAVATVGPDGLVTTQGRGTAFITAVNDGTTAVARITVSPADPGTAVEGYVQLESGAGASGATVDIPSLGLTTTAAGDGSFSLSTVPALLGNFIVTARYVDGQGTTLFGSSRELVPIPSGTTDAGVIVVTEPACLFDPALGTILPMGDDTVVDVVLTNFTFPYFGTSWSNFWVSSNGNIQFGGFGDGSYNPAVPSGVVNGVGRISPAFFDLNPRQTSTGGVFVNELVDRVTVTWWELPEFSTGGVNTIQCTLYADGRIDFVYNGLTYLGTNVRDLSVAVSPGGGSPPLTLTDYSAATPLSTASGEALLENFGDVVGNPFDLDFTCLTWTPNAAGGFDVSQSALPVTDNDGSACGIVQSATGAPVPHALLEVRSSTDPGYVRQVQSDRDGRFLLDQLPRPGVVRVRRQVGQVVATGCAILTSPWARPQLSVRPSAPPPAK